MLKCPNCGSVVQDGKFCEKCGSSLAGAEVVDGSQINQSLNQEGGSKGSFFDNLKGSMNKAATDLMAIKSNYANNTIVCMINKVPNVKEKKITVEPGEVVYFNSGSGFTKYTSTFTSELNSFFCYYVRNESKINNSFTLDINTKIMKVEIEDTLNIKINYDMILKISDIDKFFHKMMSIRQDTWKELDINALLSENIKKTINDNVTTLLANEGNLDLRDVDGQFKKYDDSTKELINKLLDEYGLVIESFLYRNCVRDINKVCEVLIKNLYR